MVAHGSNGTSLALALIGTGVVMATGLWYIEPRAWVASSAALAFFAATAAALAFGSRRARHPSAAAGPSRSLADHVAIGALIVCLPLALMLAGAAGVIDSAALSQRVTMATLGVYLVVSGNAIPKRLVPLGSGRDPVRMQARQRFCGRAWTLGGLGYVGAWLALPLGVALPVSIASVGGALLLVAGRTWRHRVHDGRP